LFTWNKNENILHYELKKDTETMKKNSLQQLGILLLFSCFLFLNNVDAASHRLSDLSSSQPLVNEPTFTLTGRSIPDMCRFIYRIETDFNFSISIENFLPNKKYFLTYGFKNIYDKDSNQWLIQNTIALPNNSSNPTKDISFTEVTMSTHEQYLFHEIEFFLSTEDSNGVKIPVSHIYKANFSFLMNRCYPEKREKTPFQELKIVAVGNE